MTTRPDPQALLNIALDAARSAGTMLMDRFGGPVSGLSAKSTRTDPVSDADRDAEAIILNRIRSARPNDLVIAEESGTSTGAHDGVRWHVDPLDGTVNYLWNIPHWAVSIHAADPSGDLAAVVYDPCRDELFSAVPGECRLNGTPLDLEPATDLAMALLATGFAYDPLLRARQAATLARVLGQVRDVRRNGSAALDLAWVAAGRLDIYYERGLAIWDSAAGAMLVREAQGIVAPLDQTNDLPDGVLAGRRGIADQFLQILQPAE